MRNVIGLAVLFVFMLIIPATANSVPIAYGLSSISQQGFWQLREMKWYASYPPNYSFSTPELSILRVESTIDGAGGGYVFVQFKRADLDGKRLQVRWNAYHTYPDERDLALLRLFIFDKAFERTEMSDYFTENVTFAPPYWNVTCSYLIEPHYPGPLGAPAGWLGWRTDMTDLLDLSSWASEYVTVLLRVADVWVQDSTTGDFDWLKVLDASDNEVYSFDFYGDVVMGETGTYHDNGLFLASGEPVTRLAVKPAASEVTVNETGFCFTASIDLSDIINLYGYSLKLAYDPTLLELSSVELNTPAVWGSDYFIVKNESAGGVYSLAVSALTPAPAFNGSMTLATLSFDITHYGFMVLGGRTVLTSLQLYETMLADNEAMKILHATNDATITMHIILMGDLNGDGTVDILDVVMAAIAYKSKPGDPKWNSNCDLNNDGIVDILDLIIITANFGKTISP